MAVRAGRRRKWQVNVVLGECVVFACQIGCLQGHRTTCPHARFKVHHKPFG